MIFFTNGNYLNYKIEVVTKFFQNKTQEYILSVSSIENTHINMIGLNEFKKFDLILSQKTTLLIECIVAILCW